MSVRCLGLVVGRGGTGLAGPAGGVQGPGDLLVVEAGVAGGGGQGAQVGRRVGLERAVGGPEQARVAVALGLAGDPAGQAVEGMTGGRAGLGPLPLPLGLQQLGDGLPVEGAVGAGGLEELVGVAADVGGRGQDVAAGGAEVQMVRGQVAVALAGAGEVGVQPAAGGADVGGRAGQQSGAAEAGVGGEPGAVRAVLVDVQDVGAGGAGGDGQVPGEAAAEPFCCPSLKIPMKAALTAPMWGCVKAPRPGWLRGLGGGGAGGCG